LSNLAVQGSATGTGTVTLLAPVTSTNRTLTLPDSTGTVATAESTLTQFNASGSAPVYAARAWVNFNGTGTVAIRASGNVSSITDNGTGNYNINFTTNMPDINYSVAANARTTSTNLNSVSLDAVLSVNTFRILNVLQTNAGADSDTVCAAVFR
jgi:hypothetical protein